MRQSSTSDGGLDLEAILGAIVPHIDHQLASILNRTVLEAAQLRALERCYGSSSLINDVRHHVDSNLAAGFTRVVTAAVRRLPPRDSERMARAIVEKFESDGAAESFC